MVQNALHCATNNSNNELVYPSSVSHCCKLGKMHKLILLTVFLVLNEVRGQGEDVSCPPCDCGSLSSCAGDQSEDKCDCCRRCGNAGDNCGEGEPECIGNLLCLPNDPYSSNYNGKCYGEDKFSFKIITNIVSCWKNE